MKNTFTSLSKMIFAFIFLAGISTAVSAQVSHKVAVGEIGHTFSPATLNINVGDTVIWTNSSGEGHNVNGNQNDFPNNPESFGNAVGTDWVYSYIFTQEGKYDYQCNPHAAHGMKGVINVSKGNASVSKVNNDYKVYPNPALNTLTIAVGTFVEDIQFSLFDAAGKNILNENLTALHTQISVADLPAGIYFYAVHSVNTTFRANEKLYIVK